MTQATAAVGSQHKDCCPPAVCVWRGFLFGGCHGTQTIRTKTTCRSQTTLPTASTQPHDTDPLPGQRSSTHPNWSVRNTVTINGVPFAWGSLFQAKQHLGHFFGLTITMWIPGKGMVLYSWSVSFSLASWDRWPPTQSLVMFKVSAC